MVLASNKIRKGSSVEMDSGILLENKSKLGYYSNVLPNSVNFFLNKIFDFSCHFSIKMLSNHTVSLCMLNEIN